MYSVEKTMQSVCLVHGIILLIQVAVAILRQILRILILAVGVVVVVAILTLLVAVAILRPMILLLVTPEWEGITATERGSSERSCVNIKSQQRAEFTNNRFNGCVGEHNGGIHGVRNPK